MVVNRASVLIAARAGALGAALLAAWVAGGFALHGLHADLAPWLVGLLVGGALLPRSVLLRPMAPVVLMGVDLLAVGAVGAWLKVPSVPDVLAVASVPFLTGYLVAVLVAVTGRRTSSAAIGALAGAMLLLLGEGSAPHAGDAAPAPARAAARAPAPRAPAGRAAEPTDPSGAKGERDLYIVLRLLLLLGAALEGATVTGWMEAEARRRRTAREVDRELRDRQVLASEMAAFAGEIRASGSLRELAEAVVAHLRRHFPVEARAVVLEDANERVAIWEEGGRVDEMRAERRRKALQDALHEAGSSSLVPRLEARSSAPSSEPSPEPLRTSVAVPVHATGRIAGVLLVADSRRSALPEDRVAALAEAGRQLGDAVRRLERAQDEQTRRTGLLLGQMREGVLLVGADGRLLLANPAGRAIVARLGLPPEGPVSLGEMSAAEVARTPPGVVRRMTLTVPGPGGGSLRLQASAEGVVDGQARLGTLVTLADVTDEERARERLVNAEKLSVVGQTLAGVAHELNNPLAAIVGYADLLTDADVPPDVARLLARVREQAVRASRIVKNLLDVARRRGPERAPMSLNELVGGVGDLFAYDARLSGIRILTALDGEPPLVEADRHALQQVLVNLVQNAMHALSGRGSGTIELETSHDEDGVRLVVRDDGAGVPAEIRERVFEPFFTTKGEKGTGLGLAISRGVARDHGGDLVLEDRDDGRPGAQFTLRIPRRKVPEKARPRAPEPPRIPDGVPARVLVVDDEAVVREALVESLRRLGTEADAVGTPEQAIEACGADSTYDAVVLDLRLPGATGIDVHRRILRVNPTLAQRVVFMTGDIVNHELISAARATGREVLEKPFSGDDLRRALGAHAGAR